MSDNRVLVVGTTPDYITYIHEHHPGRALFLTDKPMRDRSPESRPDETSEVVCELSRMDEAVSRIRRHMSLWGISLSGIACFDCEWLGLAARMAGVFELSFPAPEAVRLCRSKYLSKLRWSECNVRCPRTDLVHTGQEAVQFLERLGKSIVLKPLSGSGSELTFRCDDRYDVLRAFGALKVGLKNRSKFPMYQPEEDGENSLDPRDVIVAEELAEGREYSCDFTLDGSGAQIIRVARKLHGKGYPFGTTVAYRVPARLPAWLGSESLRERLENAARSLGLTRAICMVDFMITHDETIFLELTPRIGGDCLPPLIRHSRGLDMLAVALDFAEGCRMVIPQNVEWQEMAGLRLLSKRGGVVGSIDTSGLLADERVEEVEIKRSQGHRITLPPEDYDSWLLGHVIFRPSSSRRLSSECEELLSKIVVNMEPYDDQTSAGPDASSRRVAESTDTSA